jgi:AP-3 complex subunit beta
MKWLLAMLSKGRDVSEYFPDVVKNVVVKSVEVKKTVYIYLVHYADYDASCREIALLSINSFQKDMSGTNQLIRGLALRVMTSIRVPDIIQIQLLAVRKCATDSSPYVRKCAATALPKIFALDPEQLSNLKQILDKLLKDSSTMVLGSAVAAFNEVCPASYDILHKNYRKLCHLLADMDEWTQISVLEVMTRYLRRLGNTIKRRVVKKAFYSDEEDESDEEDVEVGNKPESGSIFTGVEGDSEGDLDPDHRLALRSSLPLLKSRNCGVVLGVCALHYYCGSQSTAINQQVAKALVRILRNRREIQYVVLTSISAMAQQRPAMFRPFLSDFLINSTDPVFNRYVQQHYCGSIRFSCGQNCYQSCDESALIFDKQKFAV